MKRLLQLAAVILAIAAGIQVTVFAASDKGRDIPAAHESPGV
jgi:hypothetical protein